MEPAIPEQPTGELNQPQEVPRILAVADQKSPALRQPTQGPLHDPATSLPAAGASLGPPVLVPRADVPDVLVLLPRRPPARVVVAGVQAEVLLDLLGVGTLDHHRLDRLIQQLAVRHV